MLSEREKKKKKKKTQKKETKIETEWSHTGASYTNNIEQKIKNEWEMLFDEKWSINKLDFVCFLSPIVHPIRKLSCRQLPSKSKERKKYIAITTNTQFKCVVTFVRISFIYSYQRINTNNPFFFCDSYSFFKFLLNFRCCS